MTKVASSARPGSSTETKARCMPADLPPVVQPARDPNAPTCSNCATQTTPLWRRSESGTILCNACSLYQKMKGCPRPVSLKTDVIKHRNRSKGSKKDRFARAAAAQAEVAAQEAAATVLTGGTTDTSSAHTPASARPQRNASSSRTREEGGRKSTPGGAAAQEDSSPDETDARYLGGKRQKRESPDEELGAGSPYSAVRPFSRRASEGYRSRSTSADRSGRPAPPRLGTTRSPSQPSYGHSPLHQHPGYRSPYGPYSAHLPSDPTWNAGTWPSMDSPLSATVTLPPIRSMSFVPDTSEYEDESRGRQRERVTLPPLRSYSSPEDQAETPPSFTSSIYTLPLNRPSPISPPPLQHHSSSSTSSGFPPTPAPDHHFPQSDSRRPHSALSDTSSGSKDETISRSVAQSPLSAASNVRSPVLEPVFESSHPYLEGIEEGRPVRDGSVEDRIGSMRVDTDSAHQPSPPPARSRHCQIPAALSEAQDVTSLRMRVAELELINSLLVSRVNELESKSPTEPAVADDPKSTNGGVQQSENAIAMDEGH